MGHFAPHSVDTLLAQSADLIPVPGVPSFPYDRVVIAGMGGSRLAGELIRSLVHPLDVEVHASYGLPQLNDAEIQRTHIIASSYSGNTAEALDAFKVAHAQGVMPSVVASGGKLLAMAQEAGAPYVVLPSGDVPPREAVIYSILGHLALLGKPAEADLIKSALQALDAKTIEKEAEEVLGFLGERIPLLYGPNELEGLLRVFKINFNETSRRPAFMTLIPELNHGEVEMFDGNKITQPLTKQFAVLLFAAEGLDPRLVARTKLLEEILKKKKVPVHTIYLKDWSWQSALYGISLSMRISGLWAERSKMGNPPPDLINEFKERMRPFDSAA